MQTDIDMNNHDISVKNPTKDYQPVSLAFLKTLKYYFTIPFYFNKTKSNSLCYYSNDNTFFYNSKKSVLEEMYLFTNYSANGRDYLINLKLKYFSRGNEIKKDLTSTNTTNRYFKFNNINFSIPNNVNFHMNVYNNFGSLTNLNNISFYLIFSRNLIN